MVVPWGDRIVLEPVTASEALSDTGLLHIPDTAQDVPQLGRVVLVGPEVQRPLERGDLLVHSRYAGTLVSIERREFLLLREGDILGHLAQYALPPDALHEEELHRAAWLDRLTQERRP